MYRKRLSRHVDCRADFAALLYDEFHIRRRPHQVRRDWKVQLRYGDRASASSELGPAVEKTYLTRQEPTL